MFQAKYIVILGDVRRGFTFHGLFSSEQMARKWADRVKLPYTVSYITLYEDAE